MNSISNRPYNDEHRLFDELKLALQQTDAEELKQWGKAAAFRFPAIGKRRLKNLGKLARNVAEFSRKEISDAASALQRQQFGTHVGNRIAAGIDTTVDIGHRTYRVTSAIVTALRSDPRNNAPGVLALALGFLVGSGGTDGNGGIPDTDIAMFGIGDHRSIFTHSILAGIVVEGSILALADLANVVCDKLPANNRSPFWDVLVDTKDKIANQLAIGASAGIAYHLAVDATIQPAAYKDLPFSMPMEAHQMLFAVNAVAEGFDATERSDTPGKRTVAAVSDGFGALGAGIKAFFGKA